MVAKKICYSEVCNLYHLKKSFTLLKSDINFTESCVIEMLRKLFKSLRVQKYQPKCHKIILLFQVGNTMRGRSLTFLIGVNLDRFYGLKLN